MLEPIAPVGVDLRGTELLRELALPADFFARPTADVARDLLGHVLCHCTADGLAAGRIVETEAYLGADDAASHCRNRRTARNSVMFEAPGHVYVYFVYGNHFCFNAVAHDGRAGGVLVRALEPLAGIDLMARRRGLQASDRRIANGPGKLARALDIDRRQNGLPLFDPRSSIWIARGERIPTHVAVGPRMGIRKASHLPLRFHDLDSAWVSQG